MNKALPIEKLRGAIFGEPLSPEYFTCNEQLGKLYQVNFCMYYILPWFIKS
jgi:hypothetical protein